jgi:hypothetical protein
MELLHWIYFISFLVIFVFVYMLSLGAMVFTHNYFFNNVPNKYLLDKYEPAVIASRKNELLWVAIVAALIVYIFREYIFSAGSWFL